MKLKNKFRVWMSKFTTNLHSSIRFRGKLFALIIYANKNYADEDLKLLEVIASKIYRNNDKKEIFLEHTYEFLRHFQSDKMMIDNIVEKLYYEIKQRTSLNRCINIEMMEQFLKLKNISNETMMLRKKIIDFFDSEKMSNFMK